MKQHRLKRCFFHLLKPGKYHTDYPKENNVISSHQHIIWIKIIEILCFLGPSKGRKWPQCGRKPGVQGVFILRHMCTATFGAFAWIFSCHHKFPAVCTIIGWNPVSPPKLPGNTPVPNVICPVKIDFVHTLWQQRDITILHCFHCRLNQLIHFNKPLLFDHWLHCSTTAVMCSYIMRMRHNFHQ